MIHPPSRDKDPDSWSMIRLYDDGKESHWGEKSFALKPSGAIGKVSDKIPCDGVYLRYTSGAYDFPWHNAPRRQIIVCLNSQTEVVTGTGEKRVFGTGDCVLAEDIAGQGHCTKCIDGQGRWSLFLSLPDDPPARALPAGTLSFIAGMSVGAAIVFLGLQRR